VSDAEEIAKIKAMAFGMNMGLANLTNFNLLIIEAQYGFRGAYDVLRGWSEVPNNMNRRVAEQAYLSIMSQYDTRPPRPISPFQFKPGKKPEEYTLADFGNEYKDESSTDVRIQMLEYLNTSHLFHKTDLVRFYADVIQREDNLDCVDYASRCFRAHTGTHFKTLELREILDWWKTNKDTIKD
jgi:hypothetical protein